MCICRLLLLQVGYSLNALVDFPPSDPISIIKHLMVGSEGTLGFISNVTYNNVPQAKHSVSTPCSPPCAQAYLCMSCTLRCASFKGLVMGPIGWRGCRTRSLVQLVSLHLAVNKVWQYARMPDL